MILAEEEMRHRDRELQKYPSSGTYNLDKEVKNLRKLRYRGKHSGNYRATQMLEQTWCQKMIVCVKLKDDIHNPGERNGQIMALKEHVKARYRLSDLIRAQKMTK